MKKQCLTVAVLGICLLSSGIGASRRSRQITYGDLKISGVSGKGFSAKELQDAHLRKIGTIFSFVGDPQLVATLPSRRLTVRANRIDGKLDLSNALKTATLSGRVSAVIEMVSDYGPEPLTLTSEKATYTDVGTAAKPAANFDLTGGVKVHGQNAAPQIMNLTGTTGAVRMARSGQSDMNLMSASLDGSVVADFQGTLKEGGHASKSHIHGTADHLTITRGGDDGTDYLIQFTGNVVFHGTGQGTAMDLETSSLLVTLDKNRMFKSMDGPPDPADTHGTVKQSAR